jgi:hypothetical protein
MVSVCDWRHFHHRLGSMLSVYSVLSTLLTKTDEIYGVLHILNLSGHLLQFLQPEEFDPSPQDDIVANEIKEGGDDAQRSPFLHSVMMNLGLVRSFSE